MAAGLTVDSFQKMWATHQWRCDKDGSGSYPNYDYLDGGFNPCETYWSNWIISPSRGGHQNI